MAEKVERCFRIKWDMELGPMWMNADNLAQVMNTTTHCGEGLVEEITDVTAQLETLMHLAGALKEMCAMSLALKAGGVLGEDHPVILSALETTAALEMMFPKMFVEA